MSRIPALRISIVPGTVFSATGRFGNYIRLSCGHPLNDRMEKAIATTSPGNSLIAWEAFKVYGGQIHAVEAFMKVMPAGTKSAWD